MNHKIAHEGIEAFTRYIEGAATARNIPRWDSYGAGLEVTGLGHPLPARIAKLPELEKLIVSVREITASQLYREWQPSVVTKHLQRSIEIIGIENPVNIWPGIAGHDPGSNGWGEPFFVSEWLHYLHNHRYNDIVEELMFYLEHGASVESIDRTVHGHDADICITLSSRGQIRLSVSLRTFEEFQRIKLGYRRLFGVVDSSQ